MAMTNGRFVWFDLMNEDVTKAKTFYTDTVGWKTTKWSGGGDYELWTAPGDKAVGGSMTSKGVKVPPHWLGYVSIDNVDDAVQRAQRLGGKVLLSAQDIPNTGRYAVLADPQGAVFGVYHSTNTAGTLPDRIAMGQFGWAELNTTDWQAAMRFYGELFGWKNSSTMNMGPELGDYAMFGPDANPDNMIGGMSNAAKMMKAPAHWLHYANVPNTDETAKKIPTRGGKILNGPMDVPGGSRIAQCMDPQGAVFGIMTPARK